MSDKDDLLVFQLINVGKRVKQHVQSQASSDERSIPYELLSHLGRDGKTFKELTALMQCSKQEVSRQVKRAEENQWVEVKADPDDARSKTVLFSKEGRELLKEGFSYYNSLESEWQERLGQKEINKLKSLLNEISNLLPSE